MAKILIVPQTNRNYRLLKAYFARAERAHEVHYLRTTIWGKDIDIATGNDLSKENVVFPACLDTVRYHRKNYKRVFLQMRRHRELRKTIQRGNYELIVTGVDSDGIGRWMVHIAREAGVPSLVCQEGCRWNTTPWDDSWLIRGKRYFSNLLFSILFKPGTNCWYREYQTADFAAVWGKFDYTEAIKRGRKENGICIVGDPRIAPRNLQRRFFESSKPVLLYLDAPTDAVSLDTFEIDKFNTFRRELLTEACERNCRVLYRMHPMTRDEGIQAVKVLIKKHANCDLVQDGVAEDYFNKADVCLTFPSTAEFGALAYGIPLVHLEIEARGFGTVLWNPVTLHRAGFQASTAKEAVDSALRYRETHVREEYARNSLAAATEMCGPVDGRGSERLETFLRSILLAK